MSRPVAVFDPSAPGGIDQLLTTNQAWIQNQSSTISPNLFTTIAPKQVPKILWLGCSDSRVPETSLLGLNPGEVFTHRNIANLFNPQDVSFPAVLAYAVEHVGTTHVILCGHSACGGVTTATNAAPCGMAAVDNWLLPLKTLMDRHSKMLNAAPDKVKALVTLSVQHGVKLLKANNTIANTAGVVVHGAVYDLTSGSLSFLGEAGNDSAVEPDPDFMSNPGEIIRVGSFATSEVRSAPQTNTSKAYTFAQPYSKPPRIVMGLTSLDVTIHNDNPRMVCTASSVTTTGFQVNINTWGSSQINNASCTWLEIPDTPDYADFQVGAFSTSDDHPWNQVRALTQRNITFAKPFTAGVPTVVIWLTGFDTAQNPQMSLCAYATDITPTGFVMNLDTISGIPVYGQWTNWVAIPPASPFGLQTADFGIVGAVTQSTTATSTFDQRDLNASLAPVIVGAMNQLVVGGPTAYRAKVVLGTATGSTVNWTASTSGDTTMPTCKGTYVTIPGMTAASSAL